MNSTVMVVSGHVCLPVLGGLRRQEDSWVFEDPVTEAIAPGYHEQISIPMDYSTVESRLEKKHYNTRAEVRDEGWRGRWVCHFCLVLLPSLRQTFV